MVGDIKRRVAEKYLRNLIRANKQQRMIKSFRSVRTIGILYDATLEESVKEIKQAAQKLKAMNKEVYTLGFINKKAMPANRVPHTKEDFYCRRDLHWYDLPVKDRVSRFANEEFDYLLNVYTNDNLHLVGISAMSKAACRLGTFDRKYTGCYDFMLHDKAHKTAVELLDAYILYMYKLNNE
jgi:hypothetical protein